MKYGDEIEEEIEIDVFAVVVVVGMELLGFDPWTYTFISFLSFIYLLIYSFFKFIHSSFSLIYLLSLLFFKCPVINYKKTRRFTMSH